MASFCNVSIMAFFLLANGLFMASPGLAFQANEQDFGLAPKPSSSDDQDILPPDATNYLKECVQLLSKECGPFFFETIFMGKSNEITTNCCQELVARGLDCHNAVTDSVITRPEFGDDAPLYLQRSAQTWKDCSFVVDNISPSPSA